jgi:hypothetical protein
MRKIYFLILEAFSAAADALTLQFTKYENLPKGRKKEFK